MVNVYSLSHHHGLPEQGLDAGFDLGDCRVEPRELRIHRDGECLKLEPRVMQVLLALARRNGSTVSRDELLAEAWSGTVVSDDSIHRAIYRLRAALSEDPRCDPVIETVPRVGYRLLKPVRRGAAAGLAPHGPSGSVLRGWLAASALGVGLLAMLIAGWAVWPSGAVQPVSPTAAAHWRAITVSPGLEHMPVFSPDARQLLFSRGAGGAEHLWLHSLEGLPAVQLTFGQGMDYAADWSASGGLIAFIRQQRLDCRIMLMSVQAREPREIGECTPANGRISLSPDGRSLVVSDRPRPDRRANALYLIDLDSGERRALPVPPGELGDYRPRWSPDGQWIAFTRVDGRYQSSVHRIRPDGSGSEQIWAPTGYIHQLDWRGPAELVATRREAALTELWHLPIHGQPRLVTEIESGLPSIDLSPDGRMLALSLSATVHRNLRIDAPASAEPQEPVAMPRVMDRSRELAVSPDGTRVAMELETRGESGLWLAGLSGDPLRRIWSESGAYIRDLNWDHAGRRIAFERSRGGEQTICIAHLDGRTDCWDGPGRKRLAPSWSHDDARIYFAEEHAGEWYVQRANCDGSDAQRVGTRQALYAVESPDGSAVFLRPRGIDGVVRVDLATGAEQMLASDAAHFRPRALVAAASGLYYLRADGMLMHHGYSASQARALIRTGTRLPRTLSLPANEAFVVFSEVVEEEADIGLLTNLDALLGSR